MTSWDDALRTALSPARAIEPTDAEARRAVTAAGRRGIRGPRRAVVLALLASLGAGAGAVAGSYDEISSWFAGDEPPGRPLAPNDDAPAWVRALPGHKRLIAENGGAALYAVRHDDQLDVALGRGFGEAATLAGWREIFADRKLVFLGIGDFPDGLVDDRQRRPLEGLTARSVARVELRYQDGGSTGQDGLRGGFVVLAEMHRRPAMLLAYDAAGREVERVDVSNVELRFCTDARGCPPGRLTYEAPPQPWAK